MSAGARSTPSKELRKHPRARVFAAVERRRTDEMLCLTVRDLSLGGMWLYAGDHLRPTFPLGSAHPLVLIDVADDRNLARAVGEVVRHDPHGIAMRFKE